MTRALTVVILASFFMIADSCKKNVSTTGDSVGFIEGGGANFANALVSTSPGDTTVITFAVEIQPNAVNKSITVTAEVNDAARIAYEDTTSNSLEYNQMPDSAYLFTTQSVTIPSSGLTANFSISFYGTKLDPHLSYMLPITITSASGVDINDTLQTLFLHINGNFLTNYYTDAGTKTEYSGSSTSDPVVDIIQCPPVKVFEALEPDVSNVDYADLGPEGWQYIVGINTSTNGVIINPNSIILGSNGVFPNSFAVDTALYNPLLGSFHFVTHYTNLSGEIRVVSETLTPL